MTNITPLSKDEWRTQYINAGTFQPTPDQITEYNRTHEYDLLSVIEERVHEQYNEYLQEFK